MDASFLHFKEDLSQSKVDCERDSLSITKLSP